MLFSSMFFLWVFLPMVIIGNFALSVISFKKEETRIRCKNTFLLLSSILFYAWGNINYLFLVGVPFPTNAVSSQLSRLYAAHRNLQDCHLEQ